MVDRAFAMYRLGSLISRTLPGPVMAASSDLIAKSASRFSDDMSRQVKRNLNRILETQPSSREMERMVAETFADYARYFVESARLPDMSIDEIDAGFTVEGFEHVEDAVASGVGPILVLPHLGGWEWAGFWLSLVPKYEVTVVVEPLNPPELHEWFMDFRRQLGMNVVTLGPSAGAAVAKAIKAGNVVCLLSDRDVGSGAVEVEFFGEKTKVPAGPATMALRSGCKVLPTAVYHTDYGVHGVVRPDPGFARTDKRLREDITALTQILTHELEDLIRKAPEQWHLMQPNWPSDFHAEGK